MENFNELRRKKKQGIERKMGRRYEQFTEKKFNVMKFLMFKFLIIRKEQLKLH